MACIGTCFHSTSWMRAPTLTGYAFRGCASHTRIAGGGNRAASNASTMLVASAWVAPSAWSVSTIAPRVARATSTSIGQTHKRRMPESWLGLPDDEN
jgi:hypothetical protein